MRPEQILEAEELTNVARRFAKHSDVAGKRALQREFMGRYKNAQLLMAIAQKGMPSILPTGLSFQQRSGQTWPQAQAEWLDAHQGK